MYWRRLSLLSAALGRDEVGDDHRAYTTHITRNRYERFPDLVSRNASGLSSVKNGLRRALPAKKSVASRRDADRIFSALLLGSTHVQKGRHNMQHIEDDGCLTQRSQLDRLRDLADQIAREQVKDLQPGDFLPTTVFVIDRNGNESVWELDHLALARPASAAVQLLLHPEIALDNLVPTQAIMRILRDTGATAAALVAPASATMAALQLADLDHEQSLTARIERQPEQSPLLAKWDFGKVAWTVRLRQVLRASRAGAVEETPARPATAVSGARPADPIPSRRNHRREMREQLHRPSAAAPSWLQ